MLPLLKIFCYFLCPCQSAVTKAMESPGVCAAAGRVNRSSRAAKSILAIVAVWLTDANLTNKPVRQAVSRNCLRGGARFVRGDRPGSPGCPSCKACSVRPVKLVAPALQGLWLPPSKTCGARPVENGGRPPANKTRPPGLRKARVTAGGCGYSLALV